MVQRFRLGTSGARLERMADIRAVKQSYGCAAHADASLMRLLRYNHARLDAAQKLGALTPIGAVYRRTARAVCRRPTRV